ncbi:Putative ABC transporter, permease protein [Mycobacteroides abscessus subsp. massiliense]|nr:Putative ABC transporter, permease protein [Mycobacteroides abscessus subsp. massiliense]
MAFGSMAKSLRDSIDTNPLLTRAFQAHGLDSIFATFNQVLAIAVTAYVVSAIMRLTKDEQNGIAEAVLARAVSRWNWLLSAVAVTLVGSAILMLIAGLGSGLGAASTLHNPDLVWRLTLAALAQIPALLVIAGIAALSAAQLDRLACGGIFRGHAVRRHPAAAVLDCEVLTGDAGQRAGRVSVVDHVRPHCHRHRAYRSRGRDLPPS